MTDDENGRTVRDIADVVAMWDALPVVPVDALIGDWQGAVLATGHPLDDLLIASRWCGQRVLGVDEAYPLVHVDRRSNKFYADPGRLGVAGAARGRSARRVRPTGKAFIQTTRALARMMTVERRGQPTAAMVFDRQPVLCAFRRMQDGGLLAMVEAKGATDPAFYTLTREARLRHMAR